jgi:ABC-type arginine/histidine transport system permease subunit
VFFVERIANNGRESDTFYRTVDAAALAAQQHTIRLSLSLSIYLTVALESNRSFVKFNICFKIFCFRSAVFYVQWAGICNGIASNLVFDSRYLKIYPRYIPGMRIQ